MAKQKILEEIFGVSKFKLVFVGDSAGANLLCALTNWILLSGLKPPDVLLLDYPGKLNSIFNGHGFVHPVIFEFDA